jgi:hypothetical protein
MCVLGEELKFADWSPQPALIGRWWSLGFQAQSNAKHLMTEILPKDVIVLAATTVISFGGSGVRGVQEFLRLSKLNHWVASSTGGFIQVDRLGRREHCSVW